MKFTVDTKPLLAALKAVISAVPRAHTIASLGSVLISSSGHSLRLLTTDLEIEMMTRAEVSVEEQGEVTLPAHKLRDILSKLPETSTVSVAVSDDGKALVRSGRSRYTISTIKAEEFPRIPEMRSDLEITVEQSDLKRLIDKADFAMAQQDVRYYLNGMLIEVEATALRAVATDGYRLALYELAIQQPSIAKRHAVILPRKAVIELGKILGNEGLVDLSMNETHFRAQIGHVRFTTRLIDARYPEYQRVIPSLPEHLVRTNRSVLQAAIERAEVLSNEKHHGIRVSLAPDSITVDSTNPTNDEAEEHVDASYAGREITTGFSATYLLDTLAALEGDEVVIGMHSENQGCLISCAAMPTAKYVVMPMRV